MMKLVGKYQLHETLGEGSFGKVKRATHTETHEAVAIKILDKDKIQAQDMGNQIKKEISIMKMISHPHVVGVKEVFATSTKILMVLELVNGGELFDKIDRQGRLSEEQARYYLRQLCDGLSHCHARGICHRDLKPENLLLDARGNLKISDFGLSALTIGDNTTEGSGRVELLHTTCGSPNYVAPEVLENHGYDGIQADVWSVGVILYVLLAGYLPFAETTMVQLFVKIKKADFVYPAWFSLEAKMLLNQVLVVDPKKRLTLAQVQQHIWVTNGQAWPDPPKGGIMSFIKGMTSGISPNTSRPTSKPTSVANSRANSRPTSVVGVPADRNTIAAAFAPGVSRDSRDHADHPIIRGATGTDTQTPPSLGGKKINNGSTSTPSPAPSASPFACLFGCG